MPTIHHFDVQRVHRLSVRFSRGSLKHAVNAKEQFDV